MNIGPSVKMGYFSQFSFDVLDPKLTVLEQLQLSLPGGSDSFMRNLLAAFLFKGDDVYKKIQYLSGGEKSRLILASLLNNKMNNQVNFVAKVKIILSFKVFISCLKVL